MYGYQAPLIEKLITNHTKEGEIVFEMVWVVANNKTQICWNRDRDEYSSETGTL